MFAGLAAALFFIAFLISGGDLIDQIRAELEKTPEACG